MDEWKRATIILAVLILLVFAIGVTNYYQYKDDSDVYQFGNVTISDKKLDEISDIVGDQFVVCEIKSGDCAAIQKNG